MSSGEQRSGRLCKSAGDSGPVGVGLRYAAMITTILVDLSRLLRL